MKRLSLLRKIAAITAPAVAIAPIALTATSCAPKSMVIDCYDLQSIWDYQEHEGEPLQVRHVDVSFKTLLYGSRTLHNGNYIVFVGSNMYNNVCNFFTRDEQIRDKNEWYSPENFIRSSLYNGIIEITDDERTELETTDIGIYNFIEFFDGKFYDKTNHQIYISNSKDAITDNIDPYEEWNSTYIEQTYAYNNQHGDPSGEKYKWDKESVKEGEKIRNDIGAQCLRAFNTLGAQLYPKKEESSNEGERTKTFGDDKGQIAFFKNGKLKAIEAIPASDARGVQFRKWIIDYFKKEEPESSQQIEWK